MKKNIRFIVIAALFLASPYTSLKAAEFTLKQEKTDTLKVKSIDPVCKMKVKAGATLTHTYNKTLYGFCAESCKKKFVSEPKKYVKN